MRVEVERGGQPLSAELRVQDLHAVTPAHLLDVGGGAINSLSYQQARNQRAAVGQAYVAEPGAGGGGGRAPQRWRSGACCSGGGRLRWLSPALAGLPGGSMPAHSAGARLLLRCQL